MTSPNRDKAAGGASLSLRVLYWTPFFLPETGGIETLSAHLLPELRKKGHELRVVTSHGRHEKPEIDYHAGIPVHRFHTREAIRGRNLSLMHRIRRGIAELKRSFRPHVVHIHFSDPSAFFHFQTSDVHPAPTLLTIHRSDEDSALRNGADTLAGKILDAADWVTSVSRATLSTIREDAPEIRERSSVVYNGLRDPSCAPAPLPFHPPQILCLGRLLRQKGFDLAIDAFAHLRAAYPQARFTIAGEGPERGSLERQASAQGLGDRVQFLGRVEPSHVPALLNRSTVVVMPSRSEGLPMVALESAIMGRPVVAADTGGLPEAIVDRETGLIVKKEDVGSLVGAVSSLLARPEFAGRLGKAARNRTLEVFGMEACAGKYDRLYHELANGRSRT